MTKIKILTLTIMSVVFICSCNSNSETETGTTKKEIIQSDNKKKIEYPFSYIGTKKEDRKNDGSYDEMILYTCGDKPDLDTLKMFCSEKKNEFNNGVFHSIIFFDNKGNAAFPHNPISALYIEEKPMKHIKAMYTFNRNNGYSQLDFYEKNSFESSATQYLIN